ncbi:MAG: hypothetical protein ACUZ8I_06725 [Candidatus Scalindua sp.]
MDDFTDTYLKVLGMALGGGIRDVPLRESKGSKSPFIDQKHRDKFMKACHRGYEKAQTYTSEQIIEIQNDDTLSDDEKLYRQILYRKIVDAIAFVLLNHKSYVIRRLSIHDIPPHVDIDTLVSTVKYANKLNRESRDSFALVADLTTFIHVADILRIDFKNNDPRVSLIELKTGRINTMLLSELEKYEVSKESLDLIDRSKEIDITHKKQAKRMMRQKIRLKQIEEVLIKDEGTDTKFDCNLRLVEPEIEAESYDNNLDNACKTAMKNGISAVMIQHCIHIGIGFSEDKSQAVKSAFEGIKYSIFKRLSGATGDAKDIINEIHNTVPTSECFRIIDQFNNNLVSIACRPFVLWSIDREYSRYLINKQLVVLWNFDLPGFIYLGKCIGLDIKMSSRKRATETQQKLGKITVPTWGGKGIEISVSGQGNQLVMGGMISRFINDLLTPAVHLEATKNSLLKMIHNTSQSAQIGTDTN